MRSVIQIAPPITALIMLTLAACGPNQTDIEITAKITCNIFRESRNMDSTLRLKEMNVAREKIDAKPYLGTDKTIKEAVRSGLCESLVKGDDIYEAELNKMISSAEYVAPEVLQQQADESRNRERKQAQAALQALLEKQAELVEHGSIATTEDVWLISSGIASEGDAFYRQQNFKVAEERYKRALEVLDQNKVP